MREKTTNFMTVTRTTIFDTISVSTDARRSSSICCGIILPIISFFQEPILACLNLPQVAGAGKENSKPVEFIAELVNDSNVHFLDQVNISTFTLFVQI